MMGYTMRSSSLDYVTHITKFVQACQMFLIVAQESLYEVKYNFVQRRNFYTDFTAFFSFKGKYKIFSRLHTLFDVTQ